MAMTDKDGNVAARYEYDAWGLVTRMYNRYGERVREGIGWIGDLGTGNGSPGSLQGPEDSSGNTVPDYHPGNGNGKAKGNGKGTTEGAVTETTTPTGDSTETSTVSLDLSSILTEETEPTEDITTDLVKENPFRYAGYYFDRKTQYYYLQARYYDPRPARFISEDTYEGEIENPRSLNLYTYVENNPLIYIDPTGHASGYLDENGNFQRDSTITTQDITKLTLAQVHEKYPERWKAYDSNAKGFYLAQQYYNVWFYGTKAYDRLDEATLSNNSYLVYKLNSLRKKGKDLSKLTVAELDKMSFDIASFWFKVDTAALGVYSLSSSYGYASKNSGTPKPIIGKVYAKFSSNLDKHIIYVDPSVPRSRGIGGAHNKSEFMKNNVNLISSRKHPNMPGVETITYQIPSIDGKSGKITGWKEKKFEKTVYDPKIISDQEYIKHGKEAANEAAAKGTLGREWSGYDNKGIKWRGYATDGEVTSFYPDF
jgi:RHS repeat-associated protein